MPKVRTRFAPSPTGSFHIGSLRTALYAYLFAHQHQGNFLLRLEDTDQKREVEGAADLVIRSLKWAGIEPDEGFGFGEGDFGPYQQTLKKDRYLEVANKLLEQGKAYYCFCNPERLEQMREEQRAKKQAPKYDRTCADIPLSEARERIKNGEKATIRFRLPDNHEIRAHDLVRGDLTWNTKDMQDSVIVKSDGMALYHLAAAVDDLDMQISHVIRGEEWLPSLPLHLLVHDAIGNPQPPIFAHLPNILGEDKKKLSKRQGDVSLQTFIDKGVLPAAMLNFLAFLGWNPGGEREIYSLPELISEFSFDRVHKAGAIFDLKKLANINAHYIRQKSLPELISLLTPYLESANLDPANPILERALPLVQERLQFLEEAPALLHFFYELPDYAPSLLLHEKMHVDKKVAQEAIEILIQTLSALPENSWNEDTLKDLLFQKVADLGWKNGQLLWPLRVALTGEQFSPGAFEVASALGREESLQRLARAQEKIQTL